MAYLTGLSDITISQFLMSAFVRFRWLLALAQATVGGGFSQRDSLLKTESQLRPFCVEHILVWHAQFKKSASFISNIFLEPIFTHPDFLDFRF